MSVSIPAPQLLSNQLNQIFNNNYDRTNMLDSKIQTNEDLIRTYIDSYQAQYLKNASLHIITLASFLILILVILYRFGLIPSTMILFVTIVAIIVLSMLIIYFNYYQNDYQSYLDRINRNTQEVLAKDVRRPLGNELNCEAQEEELYYDPTSKMNGKSMQSSYDKLLKTDSNYNVWLNGDHRSSKPINENTQRLVDENLSSKNNYDIRNKLEEINSNYATYYDCEYTGTRTNGMPIKMKYEKSTIPCNYYINYKESAKYKKNGNSFIKM
jgi:hypothetical protein